MSIEYPGGSSWSRELRNNRQMCVASVIDHPKAETLRILKALDLPRYRATLPRADEFLSDPERYFELLGDNLDSYFIAIEDRQTRSRLRTWNVSAGDAISYAGDHLDGKNPAEFNVLLREYYSPNTYVGQVVVGKDFRLSAALRAKDNNGLEVGPWLYMQRTLGDRASSTSFGFDGVHEQELLLEAVTRVSQHIHGLGEFHVAGGSVAFTDFFPGDF